MRKGSVLFLICVLIGFNSQAQELKSKTEKLLEKSQKAYQSRDWEEAVSYMEEAVANEPDKHQVHLEKANLYLSVRDWVNVVPSLKKAYQLNPVWEAKYNDLYFFLGIISFENGEYELAKGPINKYLERGYDNGYLNKSRMIKESISFALKEKENYDSSKYTIKRLDSDKFFRSVYFPFFTLYPEEFLFFTAQRTGSIDEGIYRAKLNGEQFEKLEAVPVVNSQNNEGAAATSADGRVMVFVSCNRRGSYGSCDLYISYKEGDSWTEPENLGPNINTRYKESQPYLSSDGRLIIFSTNKSGGVGKTDLYYSTLSEDGNWSVSKNLGKRINTEADEISPFLNLSEDTLYFCSDGRIGMGGFDLYKVPWDLSSEPQNLGLPINDHTSQISYHRKLDGSIYWAHELKSAEKYPPSEILFIENDQQTEDMILVYGDVNDDSDQKPLKAKIQIYDLQADSLLRQTYSNSVSGSYKVLIPKKAEYAFYVESPGYLFKSLNASATDSLKLEKNFDLQAIKSGLTIDLNNIYFDFDSYELNKKSLNEIKKIKSFLKDNRSLRVEIAGYTDEVGSKSYNLKLSENRAKSVYDQLIKEGVPASIMTYNGYGAVAQEDGSFSKIVKIKIE